MNITGALVNKVEITRPRVWQRFTMLQERYRVLKYFFENFCFLSKLSAV